MARTLASVIRCETAWPAARGDRDLGDAAREVAVEPELGRRLDRLRGESRLVLGGERGRRPRRSPATSGTEAGGCRPAKPGSGRRAVGGLGGAAGHLPEAVVVGSVRDRAADPPVADDAQRDGLVADEGRLVHLGRGEAREPGLLDLDDGVGLVGLGRPPGALGELERLSVRRHGRPPGRRGSGPAEVPWETCACWPGWPLPQLVSP